MRRSVAAKALPCSVCAQLPTRVMGVRCMPRRTVPKSLLPRSASKNEDVLWVGGGRSSPFLSEREHGLTPATSAPGPALPLASLQRDRALGDAGGIIRVGSGSPDGQGPSRASTIGRGEAHALRTAELAAAPSPRRGRSCRLRSQKRIRTPMRRYHVSGSHVALGGVVAGQLRWRS